MSVCADISRVEPAAQCAFAQEYCQLATKIPYGQLFFCSSWPFFVRICILVAVLFLIFATMGVAAFDYMSPNLSTLATKLGLSQSVMGVTVLAFANGSVDVFGAMVAINAGEGGMAVGEIMGGALFVSAVVVSSMAIITPFSIEEHNFKRDACFLAVAVLLIMLIVYDGAITLSEALLAVCLYAVYAIFVGYQHLTERLNPPGSRPAGSPAGGEPVSAVDPELGISHLEPRQASSFEREDDLYTPIRPSLYTAFDLNHRVSQQLHDIAAAQRASPASSSASDLTRRSSAPEIIAFASTANPVTPELIFSPPSPKPTRQQYKPHSPRRGISSETRAETRRLLSPHNLPKLQTANLLTPGTSNASPLSTQSANVDVMSRFSDLSGHSTPSPINMNELVYRVLEPQRIAAGMPSTQDPDICEEEESGTHEQAIWRVLLPAFRDWSEMTLPYKCARLLLSPCLLLQSWSIPTASTAKSWEALCIYSVWVPLSLPFLAPQARYSITSLCVVAVATLLGVTCWGKLRLSPPPVTVAAGVGFIMGLLWVLFLATELVGVLQVLGAACHVSNTIMGLTVFALGDSLGDFVSNMTVARIGYPAMAVAACFGGPIFTLLIGVGGSCLIAMLLKQQIVLKIDVSKSVLLNGLGLISILTYMGVALSASDWTMSRGIGVKIVLIWFLVEVVTVFVFRD